MIYACEHHDAVLRLWREQTLRGAAVAHVDFHDDLRGLLVDRARGRAYPIGDLAAGRAPLDPGNFLAHAVLEGRVTGLRWIHGLPGGRAWDMGIVRYESDLLAWRHRLRRALRRKREERALAFEEMLLADWSGLAPGERLSLDWDCFASRLQDERGIDARVGEFLGRLGPRIPPETYAAYSPEYSRPSLGRFRGLVEELSRRFGQAVTWLSPGLPEGRLRPGLTPARLPRDPLRRLILALRRRGIY